MRGTFRLLVPFLAGLLLSFQALAQAQASPSQAHVDRFIGKWKLNLDKSKSVSSDSELMTIEPEGDKSKITYNYVYGSPDAGLKFWTITDMKGTAFPLTQTSGKPMNERWSVTRDGADAFIVDSLPFPKRVRYEISADGETMTSREIISAKTGIVGGRMDKGVVRAVTPIRVFDRVR
jgi:hypothetical protein